MNAFERLVWTAAGVLLDGEAAAVLVALASFRDGPIPVRAVGARLGDFPYAGVRRGVRALGFAEITLQDEVRIDWAAFPAMLRARCLGATGGLAIETDEEAAEVRLINESLAPIRSALAAVSGGSLRRARPYDLSAFRPAGGEEEEEVADARTEACRIEVVLASEVRECAGPSEFPPFLRYAEDEDGW